MEIHKRDMYNLQTGEKMVKLTSAQVNQSKFDTSFTVKFAKNMEKQAAFFINSYKKWK